MADGAILIDKAVGLTSADVVRRIKKRFQFSHVGHAGTLDPSATGLLVVLCGRATKLQEICAQGVKSYEGEILLGVETDTDDVSGKPVREDEKREFFRQSSALDICARLKQAFTGQIEQVPPAFSALHLNGERSYERARRGERVELAPRSVVIHELELEFRSECILNYRLCCSKGTYVRSLARDIGRFLNSAACAKSIRRTASGAFNVREALSLEEIEQRDSPPLAAPERLVEDLARLTLSTEAIWALRSGVQTVLHPFEPQAQLAALFDDHGILHGIAEESGGRWRIRCML